MVKAIKGKKTPPKPKEEIDELDILLGISVQLSELTEAVYSLKDKPYDLKVDESTTGLPETDSTILPQEQKKIEEEKEAKKKMRYPVPLEYRNIVDDVLNKKFGINVEYDKEGRGFSYTIVVPGKYSSMTPDEISMSGADLRTKFINYSEGLNGVRQWTELVYKSFMPEIKAQITAERI